MTTVTYHGSSSRTSTPRPQQALLTLYGDYILPRGGEIRVDGLIELLSNFGLSQQAVRSAISRMRRKGVLRARRVGRSSYYSLTKNGRTLLTKGAQRIFERKNNHWDGTWTIITYSIPERRRKSRDRLRLELGWLGYAPLSEATWISPYDLTMEVEELAERLKVKDCTQIFHARHASFTDPENIVHRCWELTKIHEKYHEFLVKYRPKFEDHRKRLEAGLTIAPSECFVQRFNLIHEYRRLPFYDPDLPSKLLPESWLRPEAAGLFREYHDLLASKANEYFDSVFEAHSGSRRRETISNA